MQEGSLHVTLDGVDGECTIHGAGDYPLVANLGEFATLQQDVDQRAYTLSASFPNGTDLPYSRPERPDAPARSIRCRAAST